MRRENNNFWLENRCLLHLLIFSFVISVFANFSSFIVSFFLFCAVPPVTPPTPFNLTPFVRRVTRAVTPPICCSIFLFSIFFIYLAFLIIGVSPASVLICHISSAVCTRLQGNHPNESTLSAFHRHSLILQEMSGRLLLWNCHKSHCLLHSESPLFFTSFVSLLFSLLSHPGFSSLACPIVSSSVSGRRQWSAMRTHTRAVCSLVC